MPASPPQPTADDLDLVTVLAALADPGRLATVRALDQCESACCGDLQAMAGLAYGKSTMSHHLKVLREAGITETRVEGTHRLVSLRRRDLDARFPGLLDAVLAAREPVGG